MHGNYYFIEYEEDAENGDFYPRRITYTGNNNYPLAVDCRVEFTYQTRADNYTLYVPTLMNIDKKLRYISVFTGENLIRKYNLKYGNSNSTG